MQLGYAVIPSSTKRDNLESNLLAQQLTLTRGRTDMAQIAALDRGERLTSPKGWRRRGIEALARGMTPRGRRRFPRGASRAPLSSASFRSSPAMTDLHPHLRQLQRTGSRPRSARGWHGRRRGAHRDAVFKSAVAAARLCACGRGDEHRRQRACGYAGLTKALQGCDVVTAEFKINFMRPALGERFLAVGRVQLGQAARGVHGRSAWPRRRATPTTRWWR